MGKAKPPSPKGKGTWATFSLVVVAIPATGVGIGVGAGVGVTTGVGVGGRRCCCGRRGCVEQHRHVVRVEVGDGQVGAVVCVDITHCHRAGWLPAGKWGWRRNLTTDDTTRPRSVLVGLPPRRAPLKLIILSVRICYRGGSRVVLSICYMS